MTNFDRFELSCVEELGREEAAKVQGGNTVTEAFGYLWDVCTGVTSAVGRRSAALDMQVMAQRNARIAKGLLDPTHCQK